MNDPESAPMRLGRLIRFRYEKDENEEGETPTQLTNGLKSPHDVEICLAPIVPMSPISPITSSGSIVTSPRSQPEEDKLLAVAQRLKVEAKDESYAGSTREVTTGQSKWRRRRRKAVSILKKLIAFLLSTTGLVILVVLYVFFGGFLFVQLESANELRTKNGVKLALRTHVEMLWNATQRLNILYKDNWTAIAEEILSRYTIQVYRATKVDGWDGKAADAEAEIQWSFAGSMLYSATVITTIGYGHIAPKTTAGRLMTIAYAIFGIPITLLAITHVGGLMATVFRFLYKNIFCGVFCFLCRRSKAHNSSAICRSSRSSQQTFAGPEEKQDLVVKSASNDSAMLETRTLGKGGDSEMGDEEREDVGGLKVKKRLQNSYRVAVNWRRGIHAALFTEDNANVQVPMSVSLLLIASYVALGALMFGLWEEDWDFLIGCYFCFITLSTIGFGDYVPGTSLDPSSSQEKLILTSLYLVVGLALLAMCFDLMQEEARRLFRVLGQRLGLIPLDAPPPPSIFSSDPDQDEEDG